MRKTGLVLVLLFVAALIFVIVLRNHDGSDRTVSVNYEWGKLREVIIGRGEDLTVPEWTEQLRQLKPSPEMEEFIKENAGKDLSQVDPEGSKRVIEQIDSLASFLKNRGVVVHRNRLYTLDEKEYLANVQKGNSLLFSRDPVLVIGNNIIETSQQGPFRRKERYSIRQILQSAATDSGAKYISMPPASPRLPEENDDDPFLEGGDVLLNGHEIYVGHSGRASNKAGIEWLQNYLGPTYKVHTIELKPEVLHLDCAMSLLSPRLGIICKECIIGELPDSLKKFDFVEVGEEDAKNLATNVFVLDEKMAIVDERYKELAKKLRGKGHEVIMMPYEAVSAWGGGFRCSHHPLWRE